MSRTVLMITDAYPPDRGGRAEKMQRHVRYLTRFGWNVVLVAPRTPQDSRPRQQFTLHDRQVTIVRTPFLFAKRWPSLKHNEDRAIDAVTQNWAARLADLLFVPKGYIRWLPYALAQAIPLARQADVILTFNNPITHHLIGLALKRLTGTPWVAEFRDAIVGYRYTKRGPEAINQILERTIVHHADRVIELGDVIAASAATRYPHLPPAHFTCVPVAGYDPDTFANYTSLPGPDPHGPLLLTYTGSFYGSDIVPTHILQGLACTVEQYGIPPDQIQLRFAGDWADKYDRLIEELHLGPYITYLGRVTFEACMALWAESDLLLLLLGEDTATLHLIPFKLWDYIAARRPILALAPAASRVASIVQQYRFGSVVEPTDISQIAAVLAELARNKQQGHTFVQFDEAAVQAMSCIPGEEQVAATLAAAAEEH